MSTRWFVLAGIIALLIAATSILLLFGGKPHKAHALVTIERTPEQVFPFLSQPLERRSWEQGLVVSNPITQGEMGVGTKTQEIREADGRQQHELREITHFAWPFLLAGRVRGEEPAEYWLDFHLEIDPVDEGSLIYYEIEIEYEGFLRRLLAPFLTSDEHLRLERELANLKGLVERRTRPLNEPEWEYSQGEDEGYEEYEEESFDREVGDYRDEEWYEEGETGE